MKRETENNEEIAPSGITRKNAIKKIGKYAAITALGTFMILNPKKAQATSASPSPDSGSGDSGGGAGDESGDPPTRGSENPPAPGGWND